MIGFIVAHPVWSVMLYAGSYVVSMIPVIKYVTREF